MNRLEKAERDLDVYFKPKKSADETNVISPMLKVKHKESGLKYTVDQVGTNSVVIRDPEGKTINLTADELEKDFELE